MASECAILGTHAIYVNTLKLGYTAEEDKKYHLVSDFSNRICTDDSVLAEAIQLLQNPDLKKEGKRPLLVSVDIYRPAAIQQLAIVAKGVDVPVYPTDVQLEPAAICQAAKSCGRVL